MTPLTHRVQDELRTIVDKQLASLPLSSQEVQRLQELLREDEHMQYYLQSMELDAYLPDAVENADLAELISLPKQTTRFRWQLAIGIAAVACIMFVAGWITAFKPKAPTPLTVTPSPTKILPKKNAQITSMFGVRWGETSGYTHHPEKIVIESGLVELTYETGVSVIIEGPADYTITGINDGLLTYGKFVANVPKGAEGFTVKYPMGKVVDLGTEFGVDLTQNGELSIGVFKGKVELHTNGSDHVSLIEESHALNLSSSTPGRVSSIPFDRDSYIRTVPSREFSWFINSKKTIEKTFDVSHLIWKPGDYRIVMKWMSGYHAANLSNATLWLDGKMISSDLHNGTTGSVKYTQDNIYQFKISPNDFKKGNWELKVQIKPIGDDPSQKINTKGTLLFEEGLAFKATSQDFIGCWRYTHDGGTWERHINSNGSIDLYLDGVLKTGFTKSHWEVENGILKVWIPHKLEYETHLLRDAKTMIFINKNYRNAVKIEN